MGRSRSIRIQESQKRLSELDDLYEGTPLEDRLRMLRLLKENPARSIAEVAALIGRSVKTVEWWWRRYREGGIPRLLEYGEGRRGAPCRLDDEQIGRLATKVGCGDLQSGPEVAQWVSDTFGVDYSHAGARHLAARVRETCDTAAHATVSQNMFGNAGRLLSFVNALPVVGDQSVWTRQFQTQIVDLFPDVDKVLVVVNHQCDLKNNEVPQSDAGVFITRHVGGSGSTQQSDVDVEPEMVGESHAARILATMQRRGFPLEQYHTPHEIECDYDGSYLGLLVLFRQIDRSPISRETIREIEMLQPFLTFILAHLVMRIRYYNPSTLPTYYAGLDALRRETRLGKQQIRIITHLILGSSIKEIAASLSIAEGTVKKQLNLIYQKTGTHSHNELFAKYFTPRVETKRSR